MICPTTSPLWELSKLPVNILKKPMSTPKRVGSCPIIARVNRLAISIKTYPEILFEVIKVSRFKVATNEQVLLQVWNSLNVQPGTAAQ